MLTSSSSWGSKLTVLRERSFRQLLAGQSISFMGDALANVALAFALIELGGGAPALGIVLYGCWTIVGPLVTARDLGGAPAWGFIISAQGVGGIVGGVLAFTLQLAGALGLLSLRDVRRLPAHPERS